MQLQRLGVPTLRNPFWGRLVLAAAIAVVLLLYVTIRSSGTTSTAEVFGSRGHVQLVQPNASIENRLAGSVHQNRWREHAGDLHGTPGEIPKVLYVSVADKAKMPAVSQSSLNSCKKLNPAYKVEVMGDAERNETFAKHAPSLLPVYSRLKPTERNDFWSYLMLYLFGGWYIDHDVQCFKPFDDFTANFNRSANAVVGVEAVLPEGNRNEIGFCCPVQYCHWVMGSAPGHALYGHVVDLILDSQVIATADPNSAAGKQKDNPVMTTGPGIFTKAVEHFMALFEAYPLDIALEEPQMVADLGVMPRTAVSVGGYGTDNAPAELIYVKHMFAGTWKHSHSGSWFQRLCYGQTSDCTPTSLGCFSAEVIKSFKMLMAALTSRFHNVQT